MLFFNIFSAIYVEKSACCKSIEPDTNHNVTVCYGNSVGGVTAGLVLTCIWKVGFFL